MRILWLCNIPLPSISAKAGLRKNVEGGWLIGLSNDILLYSDCSLTYLFPCEKNVSGRIENLDFLGFKSDLKFNDLEDFFVETLSKLKPECVHIFGTEFSHSLAMMQACKKMNLIDNTIVSIQGLVSVYAKHFFAFLPLRIINKKTLFEMVKKRGIVDQKNQFISRGKKEEMVLKSAKYVIGRTDWDRACALSMNPSVQYFPCNETLRDSFYKTKWSIDKCDKRTIFVSQSHYPIKGFHLLLEALPEILKDFPDARLYTTMENPFVKRNLRATLLESTYIKYIKKIILRKGLIDHIVFLGPQNEKEILERFLKANVFVCASSIENSSNSIGEAMILGVPTVASFVGGTPSIFTHNSDGFLFQADAPYMLSFYIKRIFSDDNLAKSFSINSRKHALLTHNKEINLENILAIYTKIGKTS